jgi:hypothetical protein
MSRSLRILGLLHRLVASFRPRSLGRPSLLSQSGEVGLKNVIGALNNAKNVRSPGAGLQACTKRAPLSNQSERMLTLAAATVLTLAYALAG